MFFRQVFLFWKCAITVQTKDAESLAIDILTFLMGISSRDGEKYNGPKNSVLTLCDQLVDGTDTGVKWTPLSKFKVGF
ncbi:hypothetical protein EWH99_07250 [Sporolactobacillus sp. THM7-7]|nr:hypothetical protein EWH99_07250 [Sporolactobacillus sp. THM7-7]